mgnify:CR=1 FL=1
MKNIFRILFAFLLAFVFTVSCSKDDDDSGIKEGTGTVVIDGKTTTLSYCVFMTTSYGGYEITQIALGSSQQNTASGEQLTISIVNQKIEKKTYEINVDSNGISVIYSVYDQNNPDATKTYFSISGTVTLTSVSDKLINGDYDVTVQDYNKNTKTLKGSFSAKAVPNTTSTK